MLLVVFCLFVLPAVANASDIRQLPYIHKYEIVKDAGMYTFVVCDDCPEKEKLTENPKQKLLRSLAVRGSNEITEKQAFKSRMNAEATTVNSPTHELSCLLASIHFGFDSHELLPGEKNKLLHISKMLRESEKVTVKVEGYTCDIGTEEYNQALATKRAEVVAAFLKKNGVNVVEIRGKGGCCGVSTKDKALNRRAEIILQTTVN